MTHAIMIAHIVAVVLLLIAAFKLRDATKSAFKRDMSPVEAMQMPLFFACLDIAYNLSAYRLLENSIFMFVGACLHCVLGALVIYSARAVKQWR